MTQQQSTENQASARIPLRLPLHPDINEPLIEQLVRRFYDKVRVDAELGPIFARVITGDWEPHLQTMMAFWSSVTMTTGRYKGMPMPKHVALTDVRPEHFSRWLELFRQTAHELCPTDIADIFIDRADRIAASLSLGMFGVPYTEAMTRT